MTASGKLVYPEVGQIFTLTLQPVRGLEMVKNDGYGDWEKWRFVGTEIVETQTGQFKLVQVGYQPNLEAVRRECEKQGSLPPGQWREAFKVMYQPDRKGPIGFADPSWVRPLGLASFPYVGASGYSDFDWADDDRGDVWRWLVGVEGK